MTATSPSPSLLIKYLGEQPYETCLKQMQTLTAERTPLAVDEIWAVQHPPVYTQGQAGKPEHILRSSQIPLIQSDRGGQVTYHGPGQIVIYLMLDLRRLDIGIRSLVCAIEQAVIALLADYQLVGHTLKDAPGVYINNTKICSLGLRVKRGCCYHGLALNADMDLAPFDDINPCGYQGLAVTQLRDCIKTEHSINLSQLTDQIIHHIVRKLGYNLAQIRTQAD